MCNLFFPVEQQQCRSISMFIQVPAASPLPPPLVGRRYKKSCASGAQSHTHSALISSNNPRLVPPLNCAALRCKSSAILHLISGSLQMKSSAEFCHFEKQNFKMATKLYDIWYLVKPSCVFYKNWFLFPFLFPSVIVDVADFGVLVVVAADTFYIGRNRIKDPSRRARRISALIFILSMRHHERGG